MMLFPKPDENGPIKCRFRKETRSSPNVAKLQNVLVTWEKLHIRKMKFYVNHFHFPLVFPILASMSMRLTNAKIALSSHRPLPTSSTFATSHPYLWILHFFLVSLSPSNIENGAGVLGKHLHDYTRFCPGFISYFRCHIFWM